MIQPLPIFIVGAGDIRTLKDLARLIDRHDPIGLNEWQRLEQCGICESKDRNTHSHAQPENQHCSECETWSPAHLAQSKTQVLDDRFNAKPDNFVAPLLEARRVAELPRGSMLS